MRSRAKRRGLSPLIATVVLISATIVGGMLVYNYFQKSFNSLTAGSGALQITASSEYLNETSKLVHLDLYNMYDKPVTLIDVVAVKGDGSTVKVPIVSGGASTSVISSGEKQSLIVIAPNDAVAIYAEYKVEGSNTILQSSPVRIS